jgi:hypothetical protein
MLECDRITVAGLTPSPFTLLVRLARFAVPEPQRYSFHPFSVPFPVSVLLLIDWLLARMVELLVPVSP